MDDGLLPIGRFSRITGLSVKALRHYGRIGLLEPARVDGDTAYRYYDLTQAPRAEAIRRLRELEVPLDEIDRLLDAPPEEARHLLAAHQSRLERRAGELQRAIDVLTDLIDGKEPLVPEPEKTTIRFQLDVKEVPAQNVLTVRDHVHQDEMPQVVPRQIEEVRAYLNEIGVGPSGPPICICPFPDEEGRLDSETGWLVPEGVQGRGRIEAKTLPATRALVMEHVGPYEELSRSYRLMSEVMEEHGLEPVAAPREIYRSDPAEVPDPNDYLTEIVWPIGEAGEFKPSGDRFQRRVTVD